MKIRTTKEISAKIEDLLYFQKKTKAGLGIALGAKETDGNQSKFQKFSLLKRGLKNGRIDLEKMEKVAKYLETTIEELLIKKEIGINNNQNNSSFVQGSNNSLNVNTMTENEISSEKKLTMEEKIDILFDKAFKD